MYSLALLTISALLLTLAFTTVVRTASARLGWVDRPGPRKVHTVPVPRTGGIAIVGGYAVAFLILFYSPLGGGRVVAAELPGARALLPAVLVAFATGLADDIRQAAAFRWSLGPLTLPHELARVVVLEQLYRAFTILRGEPYHK